MRRFGVEALGRFVVLLRMLFGRSAADDRSH